LEALTGTTIVEPLRMAPLQHFRHPAARMLRQYLPLLVETLGAATLPFPDWWIAQTEQLIMTLFLSGHRHNYSHLLEREAADAAPWQVRRAEEYIVENAHRAISLEELAEVAGVSAFGLFAAFRSIADIRRVSSLPAYVRSMGSRNDRYYPAARSLSAGSHAERGGNAGRARAGLRQTDMAFRR